MESWKVLLIAVVAATGCKSRPALQSGPVEPPNGPQVAEMIPGAGPAQALFCDTDLKSAYLATDEVVGAVGDGFYEFIRLEDGKSLLRTNTPVRFDRFWASVTPRGEVPRAVALADGAQVPMSESTDLLQVLEDGPAGFWFVTRQTDPDDKRSWHYGTFKDGKLSAYPAGKETGEPVLLQGALWTQTSDCILQRFAANGDITCVDERKRSSARAVTAVGTDHIVYSDDDGVVLYDARKDQREDLGCESPMQLRGRVVEPPALLLRCGSSVQFWTPKRGAAPAIDRGANRQRESIERSRFMPLGDGRYFDAAQDEVVESTIPLDQLTKSGHGVAEGRLVDWDQKRSRAYSFQDCDFMGGGAEFRFEHWVYESCTAAVSDDELQRARDRPPTITSCGSPGREARRLTTQRLVDLRDGTAYPVSHMKVVGLSRHGVVGVIGSGHDLVLDTPDGVQVVLQPYPPAPSKERTDWEPLEGGVVTDEKPVRPYDPADYQNAVFEWTCLWQSNLSAEEKNAIVQKIYARYGFSEKEFGGFEQTERLNPRMKMEIFQRVRSCTEADAMSFGRD